VSSCIKIFQLLAQGKTTTTPPTAATSATTQREKERKTDKGKSSASTATTTTTTTSNLHSPDAERVQLTSGNTHFLCKINLSPHETAVINVKARLYTKNLQKLYKNASQFKITSTAQFVPNESFKLDPSGHVTIATVAKVKDPVFQQGKYITYTKLGN